MKLKRLLFKVVLRGQRVWRWSGKAGSCRVGAFQIVHKLWVFMHLRLRSIVHFLILFGILSAKTGAQKKEYFMQAKI